MRTICLAYKDLSPNECGPNHDLSEDGHVKDIEKTDLTLICIFRIINAVIPDVPRLYTKFKVQV